MRINTNISAIVANSQLQKTEDKLALSLERLSSGYKINHSKDNPAGLAISQKMNSQLRGLDQADNNAQDGISVLQTAEGGMIEIQSMLARMKELTIQAANDVNAEDERAAIQEELDSLNKEIDRISNDTDFNTKTLLNGNLERRVYSDVANVKQLEITDGFTDGIYSVTVTGDAKRATITSSAINVPNTGITAEQAGTVKINGLAIEISEGDTIGEVASKLADGAYMAGALMINAESDAAPSQEAQASYPETDGYVSVPAENGTSFVFLSVETGSNESIEITCDNEELAAALGLSTSTIATGKDCVAEFTTANGERVGFNNSATMSAYGNEITIRDNNDKTFVMRVPTNVAALNGGSVAINQEVTDMGTLRVHVGANENQIIAISIPEVSAESLGLDNLNVYTYQNAGKATAAVDAAISKLSTIRSKIGAYQNRLEHTTENLGVSTENLTAAYARIMDVDMAEEMTEYTQANVLSQAGISMLSQANARPETVLQLLQ